MWTATTRAQHARAELTLPSDLTDAEWAVLEPFFPPVSVVRRWFYLWRNNGLWLSLKHTLLLMGREATDREASPSAGVLDSQSVKTTKSGGPRGYESDKKIKGRKRHILTDSQGNLVHAVIHTADIQDRDGAPLVPNEFIHRFPWLRHVFADGGYAGDKLRQTLRKIGKSRWLIEFIKRSDKAKGLEVLPRRWVVERTLAWLDRNRRLAKGLRTNHRLSDRMAVHRLNTAPYMAHRKIMKS